MKYILVCGSRNWPDREFMERKLDSNVPMLAETCVLTGGAGGVDSWAHQWALQRNLRTTVMPAEWNRLGRSAGPVRNLAMLDLRPEKVLAFHSGNSRGTAHCIRHARDRGITVIVWTEADLVVEAPSG